LRVETKYSFSSSPTESCIEFFLGGKMVSIPYSSSHTPLGTLQLRFWYVGGFNFLISFSDLIFVL
jgi:hypothetical protein